MLPIALLGVLTALSSIVSADTAGDSQKIQEATALYPPCAQQCLETLVPLSACSRNDTDCLCQNEHLRKETQTCVLDGCTKYEGLQAQNATMTMCGRPVRNKQNITVVISVTGGSLALLAFVMRMGTLLVGKSGREIGADDYLAGAALLMAGPPTLTTWAFKKNGLGKDIWTLRMDQIKMMLKLYYLGSIFYVASVTMVKLSLICFILRVFPDGRFRRLCYGVMGVVAAYGTSFVMVTAFQCWPPDYAWEQIDESRTGRCNNVHVQAWFAAIFNIVLDLVLLVLPLRSLWGLQIGLKKKLMIMSMFSLGIFVTIISCVRLHTLIKFAKSVNISWDYVEAGYWSLVEMHASIICACLPYCRHFLISFGANFLQSTGMESDAKTFGSKATGSRRGNDGTVVPSGKADDGQQTPKHGDEGDCVPLVEYPSQEPG